MFETLSTGNGNGNKMNLRIEILEGLLNSLGEGTNAKINSLKHTIISNKTNMADNPAKSLDLMRRVFFYFLKNIFKFIFISYSTLLLAFLG